MLIIRNVGGIFAELEREAQMHANEAKFARTNQKQKLAFARAQALRGLSTFLMENSNIGWEETLKVELPVGGLGIYMKEKNEK